MVSIIEVLVSLNYLFFLAKIGETGITGHCR